MADFNIAVQTVLRNEGGYSNDPDDPGGETKYGISKRSHPDLNIANLSMAEAIGVYQREYWKYDEVSDQAVATKIFDCAVNHGNVRIPQRACYRITGKPDRQDGAWGPETLAAINIVPPSLMLQAIRWEWAQSILQDVIANPPRLKFAAGWLARAQE